MKIDRRALAALALSLSPVLWAADDDKPGGKRICVPSEDGRTWVCGTPDAPPPERSLSAVRRDEPSPEPPMFLSSPGEGDARPAVDLSAPPPEPAPVDAFEGSGRDVPTTETAPVAADVAPIAEPDPVAAEPMASEAEPVAEESISSTPDIVGADAAEAGTPALIAAPGNDDGYPYAPTEPVAEAPPAEEAIAEPVAEVPPEPEPAVAAAPEPEPEPETVADPVEPEPVADEPAAAEPVAAEPVAAEPVAAEPVAAEPVADETVAVAAEPATNEPVVAEPIAPAATPLAVAPRNSAAFLALAPGHYTLQLARAASQSGFTAHLAAIGVRGEEAFAVPMSAGGAPSWMLLWGDFPSLDAARAAAAGLVPRASAWPRRAAPIQDELRAAGAR